VIDSTAGEPEASRVDPSAPAAALPMFAVALFSSAALIFTLQPLFARMVTPLLGGSPAVWNTSMVFFQAALLLGYFYAHSLQRLRSMSAQMAVHAVALLAAAFVLPLAPSTLLGTPNVQQPALWLLGVLALSVGAPYLVASATAPLLQAWYARSGRPDAHDPYFLYGASNLGSLLGLLAYPVLVEPLVGLSAQGMGWSWGYGLVACLVLASGALIVRQPVAVQKSRDALVNGVARATSDAPDATWRQRLFWMAAAAVPSSLLIGVTQHILTDIASAPFLWVPPLALYLLTFVVTFRKGAGPAGPTLLSLHAGAVALLVVLPKSPSIVFDVCLRLAALLVAALVCHAALAAARPHPSRLTEFYNYMSLGGVIGGAATALLSPVVFDRIAEFPLALAATLLLRPAQEVEWKPAADTFLLGSVAVLVAVIFDWLPLEAPLLGLFALAVFLNRARPWLAAPLVVTSMLLVDARGVSGELVLRERTFFGAYRVIAAQRPDGLAHMILHGSTIHGVQWRDSARASRPLSYYAQGGAVHEAVRAALPAARPGHAALIGLGSGAMACVLRAQDRATFIEIDPAVAAIARDPRYFTYLDECPRRTEVRLGDGRLEMQRFEPGSLDVVLGDAFSSDAIPVHLLTREAVQVYMRALRPEGALVLHVSNRHLAVANEAVRVAAAEGFVARHWRSPTVRTDSTNAFENPSTSAVVITRTEAAMEALGLGAHWKAAPPLTGRAWSDDFIPLVRTMREPAIDARPTNAIPDSAPPITP
jgi:hypothetical protein